MECTGRLSVWDYGILFAVVFLFLSYLALLNRERNNCYEIYLENKEPVYCRYFWHGTAKNCNDDFTYENLKIIKYRKVAIKMCSEQNRSTIELRKVRVK